LTTKLENEPFVNNKNVPNLFWGILAGVALAFYTIYPSDLLNRFGSILIVGWAMLIGWRKFIATPEISIAHPTIRIEPKRLSRSEG
jgi:drug/metabolite transporter (DMT)-like permease